MTTATTFKVPSTATRVQHAERGIVELSITSQDGDPAVNPFDVRSHEQRVAELLQVLVLRAAELEEEGDVTHYRHTPVQVSSPAVVTADGSLATIATATASLTVKFSAVDEVESFVIAASVLGADIVDVRWKLTEKTRDLLVAGVQRRAVKKAKKLADAFATHLDYDGDLAVDDFEVICTGVEAGERNDYSAPDITVHASVKVTFSTLEEDDDED